MNQVSQKLFEVLPFLGRGEGGVLPGAFPDDLIDSRIGIHDSHHFEVKLDYSIDPKRRKNRYRVELFLFTPLSLGITQDTYRKKQFYNDIQAYIRFKTPNLPLAALLNGEDPGSPLTRLGRALPSLVASRPEEKTLQDLGADMRLLGCLVRSNVRDRIAIACKGVQGLAVAPQEGDRTLEDVLAETRRLLQELAAVLGRFRGLRGHLLDPSLPAWLRETHEYVDEYLSISTENFLTRLLQEIDQRPHLQGAFSGVRPALTAHLAAEQRYRTEAGYPTPPPSEGGPQYVFRRGLLKKFVMSVLFLEITRNREGNRLFDVFAAVAAGISMAIATLGGLWAQHRYLNSTWPFVAAVVLLYMLKDRLKEWLKGFFSRKMTGALADWSVRIHDSQHGLDIGRCREAFGFLRPEQVPPEVAALRHRRARASIEATGKPEAVIKYEKEITLDGRVVAKLGGLHHEINDIIRFNLSRFLTQADDPVTPVIVYDPGGDRVEELACPKVYHLNAVFVLRAEERQGPPAMEHIRVVIDKRGIQSLEHPC